MSQNRLDSFGKSISRDGQILAPFRTSIVCQFINSILLKIRPAIVVVVVTFVFVRTIETLFEKTNSVFIFNINPFFFTIQKLQNNEERAHTGWYYFNVNSFFISTCTRLQQTQPVRAPRNNCETSYNCTTSYRLSDILSSSRAGNSTGYGLGLSETKLVLI